MTAQPSGFLYPQDLPDAIQRLKRATAGDQRAAIALDVVLLELTTVHDAEVDRLRHELDELRIWATGAAHHDCLDRTSQLETRLREFEAMQQRADEVADGPDRDGWRSAAEYILTGEA